jgi:hemerythrin-like domain-containing protein
MTWEEQVLFPAARTRATPAQLHSLESLEIDHERIRGALADLRRALEAVDLPAADAALHNVAIFLAGHNADEEHGVYEDVDRAFTAEERRAMLASFRA